MNKVNPAITAMDWNTVFWVLLNFLILAGIGFLIWHTARKQARQEGFHYWQYPWQKWAVLLAGILQLYLLFSGIREYREIPAAEIFSPDLLAQYLSRQKFRLLCYGMLAFDFLGSFLIGSLCSSRKSAGIWEFLLMLVSCAALGTGLILWPQGLFWIFLWGFLLAVLIFLGLRTLRRRSREETE